ncbi:signal peptidase I [Solicola sp. PLA-1-18]|uniref:signal peptidase I n=1 Tax=Solicola sp. PLA-1-18 TaxID=3380532 RepID=UPI003B811D0E
MAESGTRARAWVRGVARVLVWAVLLGAVAVLLAAVVVPRVAGATPYTILTGSMRPQMPPGTLVVVRPIATDDVQVGTVVTYQLESGRDTVVTHRVVGVSVDGRGRTTFTTQGDANDVADAEPVRPVQVRGAVWYDVPHLGRVSTLISGDQHVVLLAVVVGGLVLYAAFQLTGAAVDAVRGPRTRGRHASRPEEVSAR